MSKSPPQGSNRTLFTIDDRRDLAARPDVSIVILVRNNLAETRACIESIQAHTHGYECIVVDNGSSDATPAYLHTRVVDDPGRFVVARSQSNLGFAAGVNLGILLSAGERICLLNNDTVVPEGWLWRLGAMLDADPALGAVGPVTNAAGGTVQEVKVSEPLPAHLYSADRRQFAGHLAPARRVPRLVGFCILLSGRAMAAVGGLDVRFGLGNFEDDDLGLRLQLAGFALGMVESVLVYHRGSSTFASEGIDYRASLMDGWKVFKSKWGLAPDLPYGTLPVGQILAEHGPRDAFVPPVWEFTADTLARVAETHLQRGQQEQALRVVNFGRTHFPEAFSRLDSPQV